MHDFYVKDRNVQGSYTLVQDDYNTSLINIDLQRNPNGIDLSTFDFVLYYKKPNGVISSVPLKKDTYGDNISLTWIPNKDVTQSIGNIAFQITATNENSRWTTGIAKIEVTKAIMLEDYDLSTDTKEESNE